MRGDGMEPLLSEGDRLMIHTVRTHPTTGELWELRDSSSLAVRRVEIVARAEPAQLRPTTTNPNHAPFTASPRRPALSERCCGSFGALIQPRRP